jgi:hypothetical protein
VLNVQTNLMKPPTVDMLRTYLMTASLAFVFIVTLAPAALAVFGTSDEIFQTPALRDGAIAAVIYLVVLIKTAAKLAFHTAITNRPPYRPTASQLFRFNARLTYRVTSRRVSALCISSTELAIAVRQAAFSR